MATASPSAAVAGAAAPAAGFRLPPRPSYGPGALAGAAPGAGDVFPPALDRAWALLRGGGAAEACAVLELWRGRLLEAVGAALRGSPADAAPSEEVWHWLSASEHLTRCVGFCGHAGVTAAVEEAASQAAEGTELAERWAAALRDAKRAQQESVANAGCLRVVEGLLRRLEGDATLHEGSLPGTLRSLMRSLQRIFTTAQFFKDERMAQLLRKILRVLVAKAAANLPGAYEVARPGLGASFRLAGQLRESFEAFISNHFITDAAPAAAGAPSPRAAGSPSAASDGGGSLSARRSSGGRSPGLAAVGSASRREGSADARPPAPLGGWWRAANRTSQEHADHCRNICSQVAALLRRWASLSEQLPALQAADPELLRDVESFRELHSGIKAGGAAAELLDPKHRIGAAEVMRVVQERLVSLCTRAQAAGVKLSDEPACLLDETLDDLIAGGVDILVLPDDEEAAGGALEGLRAATAVQEGISSIQEDLRRFSEELERRLGPGTPFAPLPRLTGAAPGGSPAAALAEDEEDEAEAAEQAAALEVAKRSSWYHAPPPLLGPDVPLIQVRTAIERRVIRRAPSRPRTAQPALAITRPPPTATPPSEPRTGRPQRPATAAAVLQGGAHRSPSPQDAPRSASPSGGSALPWPPTPPLEPLGDEAQGLGEAGGGGPGGGGRESSDDDAQDAFGSTTVSWNIG